MSEFRIHPRLLEDCHCLGRLGECYLLLSRNAAVPWFVLVPDTESENLLALPPPQRNSVLADAATVAGFITDQLGWPRINLGAIGNVVAQLHVHVIGRRPGDACWPAPVWGHLAAGGAYSDDEVAAICDALIAHHGMHPCR